jgi:protein SCO1/2
MIRLRRTAAALVALFLLFVCVLITHAAPQTYPVRGLLLKIDERTRTLLISCESIPGYMDAMVMPFNVRDTAVLDNLHTGSLIDFQLVVDGNNSYVEDIRQHHYESVEADPIAARRLKDLAAITDPENDVPEIQVGSKVPDFTLIDQLGRDVSLSELRGKVVALTFTYTHCVLPNFCFRIANNFRQLQGRFASDLGKDLVFMSITFDPAHDTPARMAEYGKTWSADPNSWHLLTGSPAVIDQLGREFGLSYWVDEGVIIHSLHTVLINPDGTVAANLEGNEFTATELGDLIQSILSKPQAITTAHTMAHAAIAPAAQN